MLISCEIIFIFSSFDVIWYSREVNSFMGQRVERGVAPVDQPQVVGEALKEVLVGVGVGVDEAGDHGPAASVDYGGGMGRMGTELTDSRHVRAVDEDVAIELDAVGRADDVTRTSNQDRHKQLWLDNGYEVGLC